MSSGVQVSKNGAFTGTGSAVNVTSVGFRPRRVELYNTEGLATAVWTDTMADGKGVKQVTDGTVSFMSSNGITPLANGFRLGTDSDLNVSGEDVHWVAHE